MDQKLLIACFMCLAFAPQLRASNLHDIAATQFVDPVPGSRILQDTGRIFKVRIINVGLSNEASIPVAFELRDYYGVVTTRDTLVISSLAAGSFTDVSFGPFAPPSPTFYVTARTLLVLDQDVSNDQVGGQYSNTYSINLESDSVTTLPSGALLKTKSGFRPIGYFRVTPYFLDATNISVRLQIRRCNDQLMFFQADTTVPDLFAGQAATSFGFPSQLGIYDVRRIPAGCYVISAFTRHSRDVDHTNDTSSRFITILPNQLNNDVAVDSAIRPFAGEYLSMPTPIPIQFRFENMGLNAQASVATRVTIRDNGGAVVYQDSQRVINWASGERRTISFATFVPASVGVYTLLAQTLLPSDEYPFDDSLSSNLTIGVAQDASVDSISVPSGGDTIAVGTPVSIRAAIHWRGSSEPSDNILAVLQIKRRSTGQVVAEYDTSLNQLTTSARTTVLVFPSRLPTFDLGSIRYGDYGIQVFVHTGGDVDHTNDTARATIYFRGLYDLSVDSITSPSDRSTIQFGDSIRIAALITNTGLLVESGARIAFEARGLTTASLARDTVLIATLARSNTTMVRSAPLLLTTKEKYVISAQSLWGLDSVPTNDIREESIAFGINGYDAACLDFELPSGGDVVSLGQPITAGVHFAWLGAFLETEPITLGLTIQDSTGATAFSEETTIAALPISARPTLWWFPAQTSLADTRTLPVGKYKLSAYCHTTPDADPTNDSTSIQIEIIADLAVGMYPSSSLTNSPVAYPNPADQDIRITLDRNVSVDRTFSAEVTLLVFDALGRQIAKQIQHVGPDRQASCMLSTGRMPNGAYHYRVIRQAKDGLVSLNGSFLVIHP